MLPLAADRATLETVLEQLSASVEELLLSGLTTASEPTRQTLAVAMQEAARFKLLRLGQTLRVAGEELGRFTRQDASFSRRRLTFFLNRAWILSRGVAHALKAADERAYNRLAWSPSTLPVPKVEAACLGAVKKVVAGAFVAFEFRLRATADAPPISVGQKLTWSVVFPIKPGAEIPPEGFLHLPQKQKFNASIFLDKATITIHEGAAAIDESGGGRISLTDTSRVSTGPAIADWTSYLDWSPQPALARLAQHKPGPLDLETELQEEVVLRDYEIGVPQDGDEPGQTTYPVNASGLSLHAIVGAGTEGETLKQNLEGLRKLKKKRPTLYGLMHYERCRMILQPLTTYGDTGPEYLNISKAIVNKAALLKAMSFT